MKEKNIKYVNKIYFLIGMLLLQWSCGHVLKSGNKYGMLSNVTHIKLETNEDGEGEIEVICECDECVMPGSSGTNTGTTLGNAPTTSGAQWSCSWCTFLNSNEVYQCAMCGKTPLDNQGGSNPEILNNNKNSSKVEVLVSQQFSGKWACEDCERDNPGDAKFCGNVKVCI